MAVNPHLSKLMSIIEENHNKMSEGEYLEAMNALAALHRHDQDDMQETTQLLIPDELPPSYSESVHLFVNPLFQAFGDNLIELRVWEKVKKDHPNSYYNSITAEEWIEIPYETRFQLLREASKHFISNWKVEFTNPEPSICPFISRHAIGSWKMDLPEQNCNFSNGQYSSSFLDFTWECVCGYTGKTKNWKKHEQSERHQEWAKHRTVSRRKIAKMKAKINDDERGSFFSYAGYSYNPLSLYPGGIRAYTIWQDKNEWTHPDMYEQVHCNPISNTCGEKTWFVHPRKIKDIEYINN